MKTTWNNRQGNRDRSAVAVLVTVDGNVHRFTGSSIPGVCQSTATAAEKAGKWSNSTYEVLHHDTAVLVSWHQDWDSGLTWPQASWEAGYLWLAERAPALTRSGFERYIRASSARQAADTASGLRRATPTTAERWDARATAEAEFSAPPTAEQLARLETLRAEVAAAKAAHQAADLAAMEAAQLRQELERENFRTAELAARKAEDERQAKAIATEKAAKAAVIGQAQWGALDGLKL